MTGGAAIDLGTNAARLLVRRDGRPPLRRSHLTHLSAERRRHRPARSGRARADRVGAAGLPGADRRRRGCRWWRRSRPRPPVDAANADALSELVTEILGGPLACSPADEEARLTFAGVARRRGRRRVPPRGRHRRRLDRGGRRRRRARRRELDSTIGSASPHRVRSSTPTRRGRRSSPTPSPSSRSTSTTRCAACPTSTTAWPRVVGTGGTVTTVAAVEIGLPVAAATAPRTWRRVAARVPAQPGRRRGRLPHAGHRGRRDRVHNPGLPRRTGRRSSSAAAASWSALLRRLGAPGLHVSLADLLDGLLEPVD